MNAGRYWMISSAEAGGSVDDLIEWYAAERLPRHFANRACSNAWLLKTVKHADDGGAPVPQVISVYEVDDPKLFAAGRFDADWEWQASGLAVTRTARTVRRVLSSFDFSDRSGGYWATVRVDYVETPDRGREQRDEFDAWYTFSHVPEICAQPGFHRAWRSRRMGVTREPGFDQDFWAVYDVDDPADLMKAAMKLDGPLWGGLWLRNVDSQTLSRSYHEVRCHLRGR